jgi:hypothetical protein
VYEEVTMSEDESNDETGDLSYAVQVTDGELVPSIGPVSLFIDMIGRADDADVGCRRAAAWSPAR